MVSAQDSTIDETPRKRRNWRAVLAGGLVLGVGAAVTLAAWTDSEFATGIFGAGSFNLEGSLDGIAFTEHDTAGTAAALAFTINPDNLSPTDVVYAPFAVRLDATTTTPATVDVAGVSNSDAIENNDANLTYSLYTTADFGCAADDLPDAGVEIVADAPLTAATDTSFPLGVGAGTAPGAAVNLCFVVTAGEDLIEGADSSVTWEFAATSNDPTP